MIDFPKCPKCKMPMAKTGHPDPWEEYYRCCWCGCVTDYHRRKVFEPGNPERIAQVQKETDETAIAEAYRQGYLEGLKKGRNEVNYAD